MAAMAMKAMKAMKSATMEDTDRFLARWRSWNRELEKAEAEEQAELEKQRAIMEFDPAHLD